MTALTMSQAVRLELDCVALSYFYIGGPDGVEEDVGDDDVHPLCSLRPAVTLEAVGKTVTLELALALQHASGAPSPTRRESMLACIPWRCPLTPLLCPIGVCCRVSDCS